MRRNRIQILGIVGSLRGASYNRALLRAAAELAPPSVEVTIFDELGELPFYDGDVEASGEPVAVRDLRESIEASDALLLVTPEYNDGTSAVLKNAIDWASRPPQRSIRGKSVAVMGASTTPSAARGGIESVKRSLRRAGADVLDEQLGIPSASGVFDEDLRLTDDLLRTEVAGLMATLAAHVRAATEERVAA